MAGLITPELIETVLARLPSGLTLAQLSRELGFDRGTFYSTLARDENLLNRYAQARDMQCEAWADDLWDEAERADDETNVQSQRLRIDTKKWIMSKLVPKRYGDKQLVTGADGQGPIVIRCEGMPSLPRRDALDQAKPVIELASGQDQRLTPVVKAE
jgi:lambda repressor-like predicted transcriptional regulator